MTSELHSLVQKSCRVCGAAIGQTAFQSAAKFDLQEALLNCLKIDIRNDSAGLPLRVCQSCTEQLTGAMIRYSHSGLWPTLSHINKFNWGNRIDDSESDHSATGHVKRGSNECTLAQTLPSLCTISAKHGFLLVPEHTDERRVRFVRLVEIATNDVCASFILHIYIDLTWDVSIHGHSIDMGLLMRNMDLPRKVTRENAEQLFTSMLKLNLCPGIDGLNPICRIISQNGPAVFHDHQNQKLAVEDRFSKTVRHNDCDIVSGIDGGKQCEACSKYQPIVLQFQEKCLSLSKMNHSTTPTPPTKSPKKLNLNFNGNLDSMTKTNENNFEKKETDSLTENDESMSPSKKPIDMEVNESIKINQSSPADVRPLGSDSESRSPTESDSKLLESKYNKMRDTLGAHPASGLSLLAESAARLPLTADRPNMREQLLAKAVEKKQACGRCDRCLRLDDCGNCDYCLDKPKFGGPNTKRRKCRQRTCVYYRQAQNSSRKRPASSQNFRMDNTSLMASLNSNFLNSNFRKSDQSKSNEKKLNQDAKIAKSNLSSGNEKGISIGSSSGGQSNGHETQGSSNRRRPALQCHQCKHCAAPDCAKCRFCLDKPKFGGPGRLKQKCIERRCTLERQQDLEIKKEKERKNANALFAKEFQAATNQLASQIFKNTSLVSGDTEMGSTGSTTGGGGVTFPKPLLNHMTDALKRQHQQLLNSSTTNQSSDQLELTTVAKMDEDDDEDVEVDVDDP